MSDREMNGINNVVPVVYATNDSYAPYVDVSIRSLLNNGDRKAFFDIYVFHTGLSEKNKRRLEREGEYYRILCLDVSAYVAERRDKMYSHTYFSIEMYYRILAPEVLPQYKKAIYLDADTVVTGDIKELFDIDIGENLIAACRNFMHEKMRLYVSQRLRLDPQRYVNSGVLVINCERFRKDNIIELFFAEMVDGGVMNYPDQDLMNIVCYGRVFYLSPQWNYLWHLERLSKTENKSLHLCAEDRREYVDAAKDIKVLHFTGDKKPWLYDAIPRAELFWKYACDSPFRPELEKNFRQGNEKHRKYRYEFLKIAGKSLFFTCVKTTLEEEADLRVVSEGNIVKPKLIHKTTVKKQDVFVRRFVYRFEVKKEEITQKGIKLFLTDNGKRVMFEYGKFFPLNGFSASYYAGRGLTIYREKEGLILRKDLPAKRFVCEVKYERQLLHAKQRKSILARWTYFLTGWLVPDNIWLFSDRPDVAGDNGEALFSYVCKTKSKKEIRPFFVIDRKSVCRKRLKKIGPVVAVQSLKHKFLMLHACGVAVSQTDYPLFSVFQGNYVKDILFKKKKVFLQHGITKDDVSRLYSRYNQGFDLFITAAEPEYESIRSNADYGCEEQVQLTGFPRHDLLKKEDKKIVLVSPTWRSDLLADMTTGEIAEDFTRSDYYRFYHDLLADKRLRLAAEKRGYGILFVPHDKMERSIPFFADIPGIEIVGREERNYAELFSRASVMVSDYSSNTFEFAILRKPIVYAQFDREEFFRSHTYEKGYFDYDRDGFGRVCKTVEETVDAVVACLENGCVTEEKYRERMDRFYVFGNEGNCERVYQAIKRL